MIIGPTAFRAFGIPVRPSVTMAVPIGLLALQFQAWGLAAGILLFASVLAHELGHALVGRRLGVETRAIHLHLLGGAAMMNELPREPRHEVAIAAAGPAVSLALAVAFGAAAVLTGGRLAGLGGSPADLLAYIGALNLGMALFNLVPALPMDGGRILRAAWAHHRGWERATRAAAKISRGFAVLFIGVGLFTGAWSLALIGGLLLVLIKGEEQAVAQRLAPRPTSPERWMWLRGPHGWVLVRAAQPVRGPLSDSTVSGG